MRRAESPVGRGGRADMGAPATNVGLVGFDKAPFTVLLVEELWKLVRSASTEVAVPVLVRKFSAKRDGQFSELP